MRTGLTPLASGLGAMLLLVACGGNDGSFPNAAANQGDEGSSNSGVAAGGDSGSLPSGAGDDYPIAIPDGWVIDFYGDVGLTVAGTVRVMYEADRFDAIVAFYDQWIDDQPREYQRTDAESGKVVYQSLEPPILRIDVTRDYEHARELYTLVQTTAASQ